MQLIPEARREGDELIVVLRGEGDISRDVEYAVRNNVDLSSGDATHAKETRSLTSHEPTRDTRDAEGELND